MTNFDVIQLAIGKLLHVSSQEEAMQVIQEHSELLSEQVDMGLERLIKHVKAEGDEDLVDVLENRRGFLQAVRQEQQQNVEQQDILPAFQANIQQAQAAEGHYLQGEGIQALNEAIAAWERVLNHPEFAEADEILRLGVLNNSSGTYKRRYWATGGLEDLERAISCWQTLTKELSEDSPYLAAILNNLGEGLRDCYAHTGNIKDLENAILNYEKAVRITPENSPDLPSILSNMGAGLGDRHARTGDMKDLENAILYCEKSVHITPESSPKLPSRLNNLGIGLYSRYAYTGDIKDLENAILNYEKAVRITPENSPKLPSRLNNLGTGLYSRYIRTGDMKDLENAILNYKKTVRITPENSPDLPTSLNNLGEGLRDCYARTGNMKDLENAIFYYKKAVATPENSPNLPGHLNNLGNGLRDRYLRTGDMKDLGNAILSYEKAVRITPENSPDLPGRLNNLGAGLSDRYACTGDMKDLENAILYYKKAVHITPENSPQLPGHLNNLGNGLRDRYVRTGDMKDLENAILYCEKAVHITPENSPQLPRNLNNLGSGFSYRYMHTGDMKDLENAILYYEKAVRITPENSSRLPSRLNNLGKSLRDRYVRTGDMKDLENVLLYCEKAVRITPENSPSLSMYLNNLGNGLRDRYAHTGDMKDLENVLLYYEKAVRIAPEESPRLPGNLNNLGNSLRDRYARTGDMKDLENAILYCEKSVHITPENSPELPIYLNNLGTGFGNRYERTRDMKDLENTLLYYEKAAKRGSDVAVEAGIASARSWLRMTFDHKLWQEVEKAYGYAVQACDRVLQVQLLRAAKETWLKEMQGIPAHAAYALAKQDKLEDAVTALERGQARMLSEALATDRANLDQLLHTNHSNLAEDYQKYVSIWKLLLQKGQEESELDYDTLKQIRQNLDNTIEAIRNIKGYEKFLNPPGSDEIQKAATDKPLMYIMSTSAGGLSLLVHQTFKVSEILKVSAIWLPELTETALREELNNYLNAYANQQENRQAWYDAIETTSRWLWKTSMQQITDVLKCNFSTPLKVSFIPSGLLGLLPFHAAWTEDKTTPTGKHYALDDVIISYAPNARALNEARILEKRIIADNILAIDEPHPVKANKLPNSSYEVKSVISTFRHTVFKNENATRQAVLKALPDYNVLHFSCHGYTNFDKPLSGGLIMANDEVLTLKDIMDLRLSGVRIATLSACETGIPGVKLPDEVVSLSAGMLQAGVAGVAASLWSVSDLSTMMLMSYFYDLWRTRKTEPAEALRQAQIWVRDTTNEEKLAYFESEDLPLHAAGIRLPQEMADWLADRVAFRDDQQARDFAHPFYWAAFTYMGV